MREQKAAKAQRVVWAKLILEQLALRGTWGKVTFHFEEGNIIRAEKYEMVQPEKLANDR